MPFPYKNKEIKLIPVLAFYKSGNLDDGAGKGKDEWINNYVIEKQINYLQIKKISNYRSII